MSLRLLTEERPWSCNKEDGEGTDGHEDTEHGGVHHSCGPQTRHDSEGPVSSHRRRRRWKPNNKLIPIKPNTSSRFLSCFPGMWEVPEGSSSFSLITGSVQINPGSVDPLSLSSFRSKRTERHVHPTEHHMRREINCRFVNVTEGNRKGGFFRKFCGNGGGQGVQSDVTPPPLPVQPEVWGRRGQSWRELIGSESRQKKTEHKCKHGPSFF